MLGKENINLKEAKGLYSETYVNDHLTKQHITVKKVLPAVFFQQ